MKKTILSLTLLASSVFALAGPGHDHGEEAPAVAGEASPRVLMESDLFEAVGILKGRTLEIFVDHAATNAPVKDATLQLELNGEKVPLELHAEGEFDAVLPDSMVDTAVAVALTITAGDSVDILAGELVLGDAHGDDDHAADEHGHLFEYLALGALALLALGLVTVFMKRRSSKGVN